MKKFLIIISSFYLFLIILMPRVELYYSLEKILKEEKIIISDETIADKWLFFSLKDSVAYFEGIKFANISNVKVFTFGFFNYVSIEDVKVDESLKKFFPENISNIKLYYHIFNPLKATIKGVGDFGEADGFIDLKDKKIKIVITPSEELSKNSNILSKLKKEEDKLVYESSYN